MKKRIIFLVTCLTLTVGLVACSPYRVHKKPARSAAKHVTKPPMTIMDFSLKRGCGCH
ncbi:MAG: hypothetical protein U0176_05665 [Bacteroidia bacterium]